MYGLTLSEMVFVWVAVSMLIGGAILGVAVLLEAWCRQQRKWEDRQRFNETIRLETARGRRLMKQDRCLGIRKPLPKQRGIA